MTTPTSEPREPQDITEDADLGRPVRILWTDSGMHNDQGWAGRSTFFTDEMTVIDCETVGLWLGENDHCVVVAQSRDKENDNWMAAMVIWKPSVTKREWL